MASNRTPIPFDILTEVAGHLEASFGDRLFGDRRTLSSLSMTCSALRPICQRQLFRTFVISNYQTRGYLVNRPYKFHTLLTKSPHLAAYVKSVFYRHDNQDERSNVILAILDVLVNIENLDIRFHVHATWDQLPNLWVEIFMRVMQRPNLRTVSLAHMRDLPINVLAARSGGLVSFKAERITTAIADPGDLVPKALALQELKTTWMPDTDRTAIVTLLPICSSLRRLKCLFRIGSPVGFAQAVVKNIKDFGTLRVLKITTGHDFSSQEVRLLLHELDIVLESSLNSLNAFHWALPWDENTGVLSTTRTAMKELDAIIARHYRKDSSSLKTLRLKIHPYRGEEMDEEEKAEEYTYERNGFIMNDLQSAFSNVAEIGGIELIVDMVP